jgi:hypothetical protein
MGIPLVKDNSKDSINTSLIAIKKTLENTKGGESGGGGSDVTVVDTVEDGNMDAVTSNAVYQSLLAQFDILHPKGECYTQYPGQKDPNELWGDFSTWEVLNYGGAFFRSEGGNAEEFEKTLTISSISGTSITFSAAHNLQVGSILYDKTNNEARQVTSVTSTTVVVINSAFTSTNLTNVLIGQYDQLQNHTHKSYGNTNVSPPFNYKGAGGAALDDDNLTVSSGRYGNETRPANFTMKVWKRTN